ncbi:hypothetical protein ATANTOWER_013737 [Ataeniobius toweri]|uniref:Uncharacterized protein n=1 Tax=Ataeniobius toweri TaxID=208326 RepID=A0ABU7A6S7_9TELE|nr:hypothetical protein [Ataeniobius toweri]
MFVPGVHGGAVGSTVALQQEAPGFDSWPGVFLHGVCMFSPCMCRFSPGVSIGVCMVVCPVMDCLGFTPPLTRRLLEIGTNSTLYGRHRLGP